MSQPDSRIFVGTAVTRPEAIGGLFRSRADGGWDLLDNGILTDTGVQAITVHPDDPDLIFVGTRNGLYRTRDGGDSFEKLDVPLDKRQVWSVLVHPIQPNTIAIGASPIAFFRSDDLGDTWRQLNGPDNPERFPEIPVRARAMRVTIDPNNPDNWYAATEVNGVVVSTDGGETWRDVSDHLIELSYQPELRNHELTKDDTEGMLDGHAMTVSPAQPGVVYLASRMGIFTSKDTGEHWRDLKVGKYSPLTYSRDILVDPVDPKTLYTCFSISSRSNQGALWRSDDLGESWRRMGPDADAPSTVMGMGVHRRDGGKVFAVTRAGQVYSTADGGQNWKTRQLPAAAGDAFCITGV